VSVYVQDADFTLHHGDVLDILPTLPEQSVHCVITSPPYWGLRDYGTGTWDGGDPDCDHKMPATGGNQAQGPNKGNNNNEAMPFKDACGKCGATRVDRQLGLEQTPDEYVARMVEVFREVRRVLRDDGTLWLNLGDSYAGRNLPGWREGNEIKNGGASNKNGVGYVPGLKPKDLVGIPWRVAFALQADGWYLRSDIIWAKPNPMPESVTDRPTKAHEYVFLLTKQPRYWFDQEAVREPHVRLWDPATPNGSINMRSREARGIEPNPAGRNIRSVWEIVTQPYPEAHFATYPQELVRRCLLAGCPEWVCGTCGKARERIVAATGADNKRNREDVGDWIKHKGGNADGKRSLSGATYKPQRAATGEWSDCGHDNYQPGTVLDPFMGSGTTALVARQHGRHSIGIELNADYCQLAARRLSQQTLLA
jgi:DNA modification methylase